MEYKKTIILLALVVFLLSISCVSASEIDNNITSEDTNSMELSEDNDILEDNLQTHEKNAELTLTDNEDSLSVKNHARILANNAGTYSNLAEEIGSGGNIELQHDYYTYDIGRTIYISNAGSVIDGKGAVIDMDRSNIQAFFVTASNVTIKNLSIINANYEGTGGAIYFSSSATSGNVTNCNFTNNTAEYGGAVRMHSGSVENCNFTNNTAIYGGAVYSSSTGKVTNCNFTNNTASEWGGAVRMYSGNVTNCNFVDNSANSAGAIFSMEWYAAADTCIFKENSGEDVNVVIYPPTLDVDDFTTFYGSGEKLTFDLKTNISNVPVTNGNISISVYFKDNGTWVVNSSCLSGEGWIPDLPVGSYIAVFNTEYEKFQEINRTVTIEIPNVEYYINVSSLTSNNKTVNITAESNIPKDILWDGKLLFILPNGTEINANYDDNGIWWAEHTFNDYGDYQVNANYLGLDNLRITNASISISKTPTEITIENSSLELIIGDSIAAGATLNPTDAGNLTFTSDNMDAVKVEDGKIIALGEGTAIVTASFEGSEDYAAAENKTITVTVNLKAASIEINNNTLNLLVGDNFTIVPNTKPDGLTVTFVPDESGTYSVNDDGLVTALKEGSGSLIVKVGGDGVYAENSTSIAVTVNKANASVDVSISGNMTVGDELAVNVELPSDALGNVTVTVDGEIVDTVALKDGNAYLNISSLDAGDHTVEVIYSGDDKYMSSSKTTTITVAKYSTKIAATGVTATYNVNKYLIITLKDSKGNPMANATVTVDLNTAKNYTTDKSGQVKVKVSNLLPKKYNAKISYEGDNNYKESSTTAKVTVKKATPKMTAKTKTFKFEDKTKKYTITLKDNKNKVLKNKKVTLKVNGKTYTAKTNSKGVATFKLTKLTKKGKFTAAITYAGDKYYNKLTKKLKLTVKAPAWKTVAYGSKNKATVKKIQRALKNNGYYLTYKGHYLKIDGIFHIYTERSVKQFQRDNKLKVNGKVDYNTAKKLKLVS